MIKNVLQRTGFISTRKGKLPDFIIIGVQKGGTSSMFHYLSQHSELSLPSVKEIHYYDLHYDKGINWYKSHFPIKKNKLTGEATPYYIFHPLVPQRIFQDNPNVKLILMLRDPVTRAYSHFQMEKRRGYDKISSFEEAIKIEFDRIKEAQEKLKEGIIQNSRNHQVYSYLARGKYAEQLIDWFKYFSKGQILIIRSEIFFKNPLSILDEVCTFLNISNFIPKNLIPLNTAEYKQMNQDMRRYLENYYRDDNKKLRSMIGEKFKWTGNA